MYYCMFTLCDEFFCINDSRRHEDRIQLWEMHSGSCAFDYCHSKVCEARPPIGGGCSNVSLFALITNSVTVWHLSSSRWRADAEERLREILTTGFAEHRLSVARLSRSLTCGRTVRSVPTHPRWFLLFFICADHRTSWLSPFGCLPFVPPVNRVVFLARLWSLVHRRPVLLAVTVGVRQFLRRVVVTHLARGQWSHTCPAVYTKYLSFGGHCEHRRGIPTLHKRWPAVSLIYYCILFLSILFVYCAPVCARYVPYNYLRSPCSILLLWQLFEETSSALHLFYINYFIYIIFCLI